MIEILIALVIFEFGMLALAATSAIAARNLAEAHHRSRAHSIAGNRVEQLRATACHLTPAAGGEVQGGLKELWRVDADGIKRVITDSVDFPTSRGRRASVVLRAWTLCPT